MSDFGESAQMAAEATMSVKGSPLFMAPEIVSWERYDHRADIYSFGMLLLAMATYDSGVCIAAGRRLKQAF